MRAGEFEVTGALTTVTETFGRVSIHGVRQEILQAQCEAAGLPQRIVPIPIPPGTRSTRCGWARRSHKRWPTASRT
ncbi:hypothetical protein ACFIOY_06050 [Bradyrhizobium sp. TZ2]